VFGLLAKLGFEITLLGFFKSLEKKIGGSHNPNLPGVAHFWKKGIDQPTLLP